LVSDEPLLLRDDLAEELEAGWREVEGVSAALGDAADEVGGFAAVQELGDVDLGEAETVGEILLGEALGEARDHEGGEEPGVQSVPA